MNNSSPFAVLYIEDNPVQAKTGMRAVRHLGGEAVLVQTGAAALEAANRLAFDLIVCDLILPDMEGLELIQQLRYKLPTIPIIVVTGASSPGQQEASRQAGAAAFVIKPINTNELEDLLRKYVSASAS